ncbi:hypothetical protein CHF27_011155 [Romboutsia maritimum]|uniref:Uncharacterized protein n=1 Tax=Romboutsia maritimum TaxID=2020948 RepID=A0A371IQW7_9FIRM|nr:hypothetical protein [Romboutsia maritimum]RDY22871.1 hypothetical protein CHF27_011155 [Romboutsia maritimum]
MNIQNEIIGIVNSYSYEDEVSNILKEYERNDKFKEGEIIYLRPNIDDIFIGNTEEEISQKVANQIIKYKIKEKVFIRLMSKGMIHPIGIGCGREDKRVTYKCGNSSTETSLFFPKSIFEMFMKV